MKTSFMLVILTFLLLLITFCSRKSTKSENFSDKTKGQVVAYQITGIDHVITKKDIPYLNFADSSLSMDIYYPPDFNFNKKIPVIIIVYGYTDMAAKKLVGSQFKNFSWYISWCKIVAASGIAAITYETTDPENDLVSLAKYLHSNQDKLMIDMDNVGAFAISANTPVAASDILNPSHSIFKCAVFYYGFILTQDFEYLSQIDTISHNMGFKTPRLADPKSWKKDVPILIVRAGLDDVPYLNQSLMNFFHHAIGQNLPIILINYPGGFHGFDVYNDNDTTRMIIKSTLDFWKINLKIDSVQH